MEAPHWSPTPPYLRHAGMSGCRVYRRPMNDALKSALRTFQLGTLHEHWYGKTYGEFWRWFSEQQKYLAGPGGPHGSDRVPGRHCVANSRQRPAK